MCISIKDNTDNGELTMHHYQRIYGPCQLEMGYVDLKPLLVNM